jgi:hypothetical protein
MILRGKPEEEIPKLAENIKPCFAKREVAYEEKETETGSNSPLNCVVN